MSYKLFRTFIPWQLSILLILIAMTGCGQSGPLYLPDQQKEKNMDHEKQQK
jgi:predicted small lipoprotein YifL